MEKDQKILIMLLRNNYNTDKDGWINLHDVTSTTKFKLSYIQQIEEYYGGVELDIDKMRIKVVNI